MSGQWVRRVRFCLAALVITFLVAAGSQSRVSADTGPGIVNLNSVQFDCANFRFNAASAADTGYAAVRIWLNSPTGTPLVDSYIAGYPGYYATLGSPTYGWGAVSFSPQPIGTKLWARVYRALNAAPGSWDGGPYFETSVTCKNGINPLWKYELTCSTYEFGGSGYPASGYAAVRIWVNSHFGTPLVDSYISGYPEFYVPIKEDGSFDATVSFAPQPAGTTLVARIYRALSPAPGSWDGGNFDEKSGPCLQPPN